MEHIACIFCGRNSENVIIKENGFTGRKCPECGLIYISPRPTQDDILDLYGHDHAAISSESHITGEFAKRLYAKHHLAVVGHYLKHGDVLEIGAGAGFFLDEARKRGFRPFGIELNPVQAAYIRDRFRIECSESPLDPREYPDHRFDLVYHCDVLSHFPDPFDEFEKIAAVLKPGGLHAFETGNLGDVDPKYFRYISRFQYPDHLFFFSEENVRELLERTGFELIEIRRYSIVPQLMINRLVTGVLGMGPSKRDSNGDRIEGKAGRSESSGSGLRPGGGRPAAVQRLYDVYNYIQYLLRYKAGRALPKKGRIQTIIVIAQKPA